MWCTTCRQDVPANPSPRVGVWNCVRCGADLTADGVNLADVLAEEAADTAESSTATRPFPAIEDWRFEEDLKHISRVLHSLGRRATEESAHRERAGLDSGHSPLGGFHLEAPAEPLMVDDAPPPAAPVAMVFSWIALSLGTTAFVCGAVLLGLAYGVGRGDLWSPGVMVALGGQAGLILGLALRMSSRSADSRRESPRMHPRRSPSRAESFVGPLNRSW